MLYDLQQVPVVPHNDQAVFAYVPPQVMAQPACNLGVSSQVSNKNILCKIKTLKINFISLTKTKIPKIKISEKVGTTSIGAIWCSELFRLTINIFNAISNDVNVRL